MLYTAIYCKLDFYRFPDVRRIKNVSDQLPANLLFAKAFWLIR